MAMHEVLLDLRKEYRVTQKQVAEATGISQSTIAKIEINRNEATASTIRKLADFFNISADYLLERVDDFGTPLANSSVPSLTPDEQEVLVLYQTLSPARQKDLLIYLRALSGGSSSTSTKKA